MLRWQSREEREQASWYEAEEERETDIPKSEQTTAHNPSNTVDIKKYFVYNLRAF